MRTVRRIASWLGPALGVVALSAAPAPAATLNQEHATLQIQGTVSTQWTIPPKTSEDSCIVETKHGNGHDIVSYRSTGHALMTIVDSGGNGSIAFQPPPDDNAGPGHKAPDFGLALDQRTGSVETDYASTGLNGCDPVPPTSFADASGCGSAKIPWVAKPIDSEGSFYPEFYGFVPNRLQVHCPFFTVTTNPAPQQTKAHVPVAELRHALSKRHGKIIIHGSERFHSDVGTFDWTATTTVTWKAILIRAHP